MRNRLLSLIAAAGVVVAGGAVAVAPAQAAAPAQTVSTAQADSTQAAPAACTTTQVVANGGFESGSSPWTSSSGVITTGGGQSAHAGTQFAWLNGYGSTHTESLSQAVTIPAGCSAASLTFWLHIDTAETTTSTAYDKLTVAAGGATLATYSNLNKA